MTTTTTSHEKHIGFITFKNCLASSITLPAEMFAAAMDASRPSKNNAEKSQLVSTALYGRTRNIACAGNTELRTLAHPSSIEQAHLIFLPAIWRNPFHTINQERYLLSLLKHWAASDTQLCAVGSSSFFLAEAGLLDRRAATTHWSQFERFQKRYPAVDLQSDFLITQSENIYCASSVNSVADLVIYFIEQLLGNTIARRVEANFSPEIRKSYATSLYVQGQHSRHKDEDIMRLQQWLQENFKSNISCADMANMLGISVRSLNRRFKASTQQSPVQYLRRLKINHAKELLQHSNLLSHEVADQCGFNDVSYFCSHFKKNTGMTPREYQHVVKTKLFSSPY